MGRLEKRTRARGGLKGCRFRFTGSALISAPGWNILGDNLADRPLARLGWSLQSVWLWDRFSLAAPLAPGDRPEPGPGADTACWALLSARGCGRWPLGDDVGMMWDCPTWVMIGLAAPRRQHGKAV